MVLLYLLTEAVLSTGPFIDSAGCILKSRPDSPEITGNPCIIRRPDELLKRTEEEKTDTIGSRTGPIDRGPSSMKFNSFPN